MKKGFLLGLFFILISIFLVGCAGETTQLYMKDVSNTTKTIDFPPGTITGAASKDQARVLAQIFVDSHNMAMSEFSEIKQKTSNIELATKRLEEINKRLEEEIQKLDSNTQNILKASESNLELAKKTLELIEEISKKQGTGEITIFYPVGSSKIKENSFEYQRLVNFLDYLARESKGRKILFISIGSASAFGNKKVNEKLAKKRAEAPVEIIKKYLVNIPHEIFSVYGIGDFYSPKNVPMKEHERYQHTRLIAVYETEQIPNLPAEPIK
uniref:OmpA-like domain-containing protein n=1 Tax=Thermodesulfobacterium geofontis TaxID=1295609 RepID=A0A7V6CEE0_9BACT